MSSFDSPISGLVDDMVSLSLSKLNMTPLYSSDEKDGHTLQHHQKHFVGPAPLNERLASR